MNNVMAAFQAHAPGILRALALFELQILLFALMILALDHVLPRASAKLRYSLWLLVLLKTFLPPLWVWPQLSSWSAEALEFGFMSPVTATAGTSSLGLTLAGGLLLLWLAGSLFWLVLAVRNFLRLRAELRRAQPLPVAPHASPAGAELTWPPILRADHLRTPLALGWLRPRIYLNHAALSSDAATLHALLCHELAHIRSRDSWVILLQTFAQILHPFNPALGLMHARLTRYREQRCDDFALQHSAATPQHYGEMLLRFLETSTPAPALLQTSASFFETKSGFKQRLIYLFSPKEVAMNKFTWTQGLLLTALFLILAGASWRCSDEASMPKTTVAPAASQTAADTMPDTAFEVAPSVINQIVPAYPELAKKAGIEGVVYLQVLVSKEGQVEDVKIRECDQPNNGFEEAASEAVKKWVFKPALQEGKPVAATVTIPFKFKLSAEVSKAASK